MTEKYSRRTVSAASGDLPSDSSVDPTTSQKRIARFSVIMRHVLKPNVLQDHPV
jgi:hypothetical protein